MLELVLREDLVDLLRLAGAGVLSLLFALALLLWPRRVARRLRPAGQAPALETAPGGAAAHRTHTPDEEERALDRRELVIQVIGLGGVAAAGVMLMLSAAMVLERVDPRAQQEAEASFQQALAADPDGAQDVQRLLDEFVRAHRRIGIADVRHLSFHPFKRLPPSQRGNTAREMWHGVFTWEERRSAQVWVPRACTFWLVWSVQGDWHLTGTRACEQRVSANSG